MRRLITLSMVVAGLVVLTAQPVAAAKPVHERFEVDETFTQNLCGVEVVSNLRVEGNVITRSDGLVIDVSRVYWTHTNSEGDWLATKAVGPLFLTETHNSDGTLTVVARLAGLQSRYRSSEGITAAFDRGTITFTWVIDLNDPDDHEDDELISESWTFHGPHPEADSNFELFCEVVEDVLG